MTSIRQRVCTHIGQLTRLDSWKATWQILQQWVAIAVFIASAKFIVIECGGSLSIRGEWSWLAVGQLALVAAVYVVAVVAIASRQHALGIIMHDATHYAVFPNRWLNDVAVDLTCAFPLGLSTSLYRRQHLEHHRFANTDDDPYWVQMQADPDWCWPMAKQDALRLIVGDCFGLNLPGWGKIIAHWSPWANFFDATLVSQRERITLIALWGSVLTGLYVTGSWLDFVAFWLVPQLTCLNAFARVRSIAEHLVLDNAHELNSTRHVNATWLEKLFISPLNINHHLDHHLFPAVPSYNMPALHAILLDDPDYRARAAIAPSYASLWHDFVRGDREAPLPAQ